MFKTFKLVKVDSKYCDFLRKYDDKISYNKSSKETRPFIGVLFKIKECEYFAPLSSPKEKHKKMKNSIDFIKLKNGDLGAINFNNMIPVKNSNYKIVNLKEKVISIKETKYRSLLKEQLSWLNENYVQIKNKSFKLYTLYINDKLPLSIKNRCCNFILLEEKCDEYNKDLASV